VPKNSGPPQAESIGDSDGLSCKDYMDTSTSSFMCCPAIIIGRFLIPPYPSFIVSSFHQDTGWPSGLSIAHYVHPTFE
jgi:hypothetical protein